VSGLGEMYVLISSRLIFYEGANELPMIRTHLNSSGTKRCCRARVRMHIGLNLMVTASKGSDN